MIGTAVTTQATYPIRWVRQMSRRPRPGAASIVAAAGAPPRPTASRRTGPGSRLAPASTAAAFVLPAAPSGKVRRAQPETSVPFIFGKRTVFANQHAGPKLAKAFRRSTGREPCRDSSRWGRAGGKANARVWDSPSHPPEVCRMHGHAGEGHAGAVGPGRHPLLSPKDLDSRTPQPSAAGWFRVLATIGAPHQLRACQETWKSRAPLLARQTSTLNNPKPSSVRAEGSGTDVVPTPIENARFGFTKS